ncbi:hypothetical protein niasHT_010309 [Heterodera trifolii]|uniref:Uncharacterized protein n=1 Tax=Heterodera trifolii TaxID=157864 RepID=A0ABD2M5Y8_9BILA
MKRKGLIRQMVMDKAEGTDQADDERDEAELSDQTDGEREEGSQKWKAEREIRIHKNSEFVPYQIDTSSPAVVRLNEPLQNRLLVHRFEHCRRGQQHADCAAEGDAEKYPKRKRGIN